MHDDLQIKISQLIDNELDLDSSLFLLQQLDQQPEFDKVFRKYESISQAIKTEVYLPLSADFVDQVCQQIKNEPTYLIPRKKRIKRALANITAVAASVAAVTVIVMQGNYFSSGDVQPDALVVAENKVAELNGAADSKVPYNETNAAADETAANDNQTFAMVAGSRSKQIRPDYGSRLQPLDPRFNNYLQAHSGDLYSTGAPYQAYTQVVGYGHE